MVTHRGILSPLRLPIPPPRPLSVFDEVIHIPFESFCQYGASALVGWVKRSGTTSVRIQSLRQEYITTFHHVPLPFLLLQPSMLRPRDSRSEGFRKGILEASKWYCFYTGTHTDTAIASPKPRPESRQRRDRTGDAQRLLQIEVDCSGMTLCATCPPQSRTVGRRMDALCAIQFLYAAGIQSGDHELIMPLGGTVKPPKK